MKNRNLLNPKKFKDSYEFFEWLEKNKEFDLEAITIEINGKHFLITMDNFKKLSPELQEEIMNKVLECKEPLVYPPGSVELINPIKNLN